MGGPLTLTSTPLETSPIKRGNWMLETIYNRPPPEPAMAFVLEEDENADANEPKTLREMFEMHRDNPSCYTCHNRIDPLGFALEAFDPIGRLREKDTKGAVVDASGIWNGKAYDSPVSFKSAIMERPENFVRGFIEHMLSYAIGRKLEYYDMATVRDIQQTLEQRGYRFSELILGIVKSDPFRKTLTESTPVSGSQPTHAKLAIPPSASANMLRRDKEGGTPTKSAKAGVPALAGHSECGATATQTG